ncbi:phosphate system positive regulatory protein pho81 [Blyttiomyces sp. JEL0837]|nr:phosphate system positive regulatory protein pho81 [Blyttiomyces sp. JEL0837]
MKFGKFIQSQQTEWGGVHYLNYKALKKIINSVESLSEGNGPAFSTLSAAAPPGLDNDPSQPSHEFQALKTAFFFKLERELEKVNAFYLQKEAEVKVRLRSLIDKKRILMSRKTNQSMSAFNSLKEGFSQFQHDLTKLQKYVEINGTGFRKILKKWDKRAKSTTKELYLSRQVEIQPVFNNEVLAELTDAATTNLAEIDALIETGVITIGPADSDRVVTTQQVVDPMLDVESDLIGYALDNRLDELKEFLEKRKHTQQQQQPGDDGDFLSRVFLRVAAEASMEAIGILLQYSEVNCNFADDINNRTCVHEASIVGRVDVLRVCVEHGARIDAVDVYGRTPLHYSAMYGRHDCLLFIISQGAPVNAVDLDDFSPLTYSIVGGHTKCVEVFLENGATFEPLVAHNAGGGGGSSTSPLSLACEHGDKLMPNPEGLSPLHLSAREGHADLSNLLIQHGANVDDIDGFNGWTPIFYAASEGHLDCVKVLVSAGCRVNIKDESDWLPWTYALYRGHIEVARLLEVKEAAGSLNAAAAASKKVPDESGIQPMAPSALFIEDMETDLDIDKIPSLSLPPPIIPFRIYGHNYLDKKYYVQVNLSGFTDSANTSPIKLFGSRQLSSLKLIISNKPDGGIPYNIILPLTDDSEMYTFLVDDLTDFSLHFDIYPTFGTKVLGRAVILPSQLLMSMRNKAAGAADNEKVVAPLFDNHLRVVGELSCDFTIVNAFNHPSLQIGGKVETYWKTTKVVSNSKSHTEGVQSFITASSLAEEYINVTIQLSKDGIPVIYNDFYLQFEDLQISLASVMYKQALQVFQKMRQSRNAKSPAASPFGSPFASATRSSSSELATSIYESFTTLEEALKTLPASVGLCIELKYPTAWERHRYGLAEVANVNHFVDTILKTVYDNASGRSIIFSSMNPSVCTAMNWKQPNYGVFFKTHCGFNADGGAVSATSTYSTSAPMVVPVDTTMVDGFGAGVDGAVETDKRCNSIKEAIRFAKKSNFLGLVCEATPLIQVPLLINTIKESGLILASFGKANGDAANVKLQEESGVDAIITNNVFKYNVVN